MLFSNKKEKKNLRARLDELWTVLKTNKKALILFCIGLCAFAAAIFLDFPAEQVGSAQISPTAAPTTGLNRNPSADAYDTYLEEKLSALLKTVEGVGNVVVAVSLESSSEVIPLIEGPNESSELNESDDSGGSRNSKEESRGDSAAVLQASDGSESLVVTKTLYPKILGVVVSAKGADSNVTKERIYKAVQAFCGIGFSQIEILPMQE